MKLAPPLSLLLLAAIALPRFAWAESPGPAGTAPDSAAIDFFEKQVRPVFAEHCWACHGPKKQESSLRLDSRAALMEGGDRGPAIVPGDPKASRLILAVRRDGELEMPPKETLPEPAVAALVRWVQLGAPWPEDATPPPNRKAAAWKTHWAFQPVRRPEVPELADASWARTPIDRFILARLAERGLIPSPAADRRTLLRRMTLDVIGLPPTFEEMEAFAADSDPQAVEKVVDRLLASPRYGERWGRHWLDVARYADTKGYVFFEENKFPWAYTYRDYVVRALNEDLPYDRFILEQLAADQLDLGDDKRALAAMGFLTLGDRFMNNVHDQLDDQIDVTMRGLLGLTVTCARCHDHKYDPIPQADYYSLYGVFRSSGEPTVPPLFMPPPDTEEYRKFDAELQTRLEKLQKLIDEVRNNLRTSARTRVAEYLVAAHAQRDQPATDEFMLIADTGDLNPTMILRWQRYLERTKAQHNPVWKPWHAFAELDDKDFVSQAPRILARLTEQSRQPGAVNPLILKALVAQPPVSLTDVVARYADELGRVDALWQAVLKHAAEAGQPAPAALPDPDEEQLRQVFYGPDAPPNVPQMFGWGFLTLLPDRATQGKYKELAKQVETWMMTGPGAPPRAMVLNDQQVPYEPRIFLRGNPNRLGEPVPRQFLGVLSPDRRPFSQGSGRLELAKAIVDPANPLTARVIVNRVWQHHFGRGLVGTPSDFGLQGEAPSHPELLDYLASTFVADGWSLKKLHRRILLSAAYQQASDDRPEAAAIDPENRLLWKINCSRLDFEAMRDSLLAVSGSLDTNLGGPPIDLAGQGFPQRRTLYGQVDRLNMLDLLRTFDFPSPSASSPQRSETTIPPQALWLMNNPLVIGVAGRLLGRPEVAPLAAPDEKVTRLYELVLARRPSAHELELARAFLTSEAGSPRWQQFAQALLMTNEFVFVD